MQSDTSECSMCSIRCFCKFCSCMRYSFHPKALIRDFDGDPDRLTEMDALIAYLQMLGTLVDFDSAAPLEELAEEKGR